MAEKKDEHEERKPELSETDVREAISREREREARTYGQAPVPRDTSRPERLRARPTEGQTGKALEEVIERILDLPFGAQLGVLRTVAPRIVAQLEGRDQEAFLKNLQSEIEQARSQGQ